MLPLTHGTGAVAKSLHLLHKHKERKRENWLGIVCLVLCSFRRILKVSSHLGPMIFLATSYWEQYGARYGFQLVEQI